MIKQIYLDMDGVLVDQYSVLAKLINLTTEQFNEELKNCTTKGTKEAFIIPLILQSIKTKGFELAPPTDFYKVVVEQLLPACKNKNINVQILSSAMSPNNHNSDIVQQKIKWLKTHNLDHLQAHFPLGSKLKQTYATSDSLLIDDYERNVTQWIEKQGVAILHTNVETTLLELNKYGIL